MCSNIICHPYILRSCKHCCSLVAGNSDLTTPSTLQVSGDSELTTPSTQQEPVKQALSRDDQSGIHYT